MAENQLTEIEEARAFAQAIIDTVRELILVLDQDLRVITASRSFYRTFKVGPEVTQGRLLYELGDGHWDIPKLRLLLEKIIVKALAQQLGAKVETLAGPEGTTVSVTHATFLAKVPRVV